MKNALYTVLLIATAYVVTTDRVRADELPDALFRQAAAHYQAGAWQAAADSFAHFVHRAEGDPRAGTATFFAAEALVQLEDHAAAKRLFEQFLAVAPADDQNLRRAEFQVGKAALLLGQFELAGQQLTCFVQLHEEHPLAANALLHLGELAERAQDQDQAVDWYQRCIVHGAQAPELKSVAAKAIQRLTQSQQPSSGVLPDASDTVQPQLELDDLSMADQLMADGQIDRALRCYLRIAALERQSATAQKAWFSAARCYEVIGNRHEAHEIYTRLVRSSNVQLAAAAEDRSAALSTPTMARRAAVRLH